MKARYSGLRPVSSVVLATRGRLAAFTSSPEKPGSCGVPVLSDCRYQRQIRLSPWQSPLGLHSDSHPGGGSHLPLSLG